MEKLLGVTPGDLAGADEWTLRLLAAPTTAWRLLALAAGLAALVALVVRSYRREGDAPPRAKAVLASLRTLALLVLLVLLLEPAVVLRYRRTLHSTVVVLVDDSLSMRWADRYGDPAERDALAAFLGVDAERLAGPDRLSRVEAVRRALAREGGALARLARDHPLMVMRFSTASPGQEAYTEVLASTQPASEAAREPAADAARSVPPPAAPRPAADAAGNVPPPPLPPEVAAALARLDASGFETSLGRAVREAIERVQGRRVAALVVVSDGRETVRGPAERLSAAAEVARQRGIPIYGVAVGDPAPLKNLLVAQLRAPAQVRRGSTATMTAFLAHRGLAGTTVTVDLARARAGADGAVAADAPWEPTGVTADVTLAGAGEGGGADADEAGRFQEVPLQVPMDDAGAFLYRASVRPRDDELDPADNEAVAPVRVTEERTAVLLVSGDGGWEFQYLRNYLLRQRDLYATSTWQQNADPAFNQEASSGMQLRSLPRTREDLFRYDAVLLLDPRHTTGGFDAEFAQLLEDFVGRHHGGLAYVAGTKFTAANLLGGGTFDALGALLPVVLERDALPLAARIAQGQRTAWPVEPTAFGADHPVMQLDADAQAGALAWRLLPGLYWSHPVGRLKTLASALAVSGDPARRTADSRPEPVLAVQYYGKGRVLYAGFDGSWRWRAVRDGRLYERFWANVLGFLSAGRTQKKRILVTTGGTTFDAGSLLRVRVEAWTRDYAPMPGRSFTVRLADLDRGESADYVLEAVRDGLFEGTVPARRTGRFEIRPHADASGASDWTDEDASAKRIDVRLPQEEFRRREADRAPLRDLAGADDRLLRLHEVDALADRIPPGRRTTVTEVPRPLWPTLLALAALGVPLLAEWALRKVYNMA